MTYFRDGISVLVVIVAIMSAGGVYTALATPEVALHEHDSALHTLTQERGIERCHRTDNGSHLQVAAACRRQGIEPTLSINEAVDALMPYVIDAEQYYSVTSYSFSYHPTGFIFEDGFVDAWKEREESIEEEDNEYISYPKSYLAMRQHTERSIYAAVRDTSTYGKCRLQNYEIALREINGTLLAPGEKLNMNKVISNQPDYCRGTGEKYLFYQGVCGASTQLFWNALINPSLRVTRRSAHGKRYAGFYGSTIMGDDASLYQYAKQLEVKNDNDVPVYFSTLIRPDGNIALLSIVPKKTDLFAEISKQQTAELSAVVFQRIVDSDGQVSYENERTSHYRAIDTTVDKDL